MKPHTNAKTVYGLLNAVARIVLEEPRRLNMADWKVTSDDAWSEPPLGYPDCGAVCCIGGWMEMLVPISVIATIGRAMQKELCYPQQLLQEAGNGAAQTPEHAKKTVAHIRAFQKKYKAQLRAIKLPEAKR